ncbi:MAG: polysaccharide deacetylase family protein [Rhodospirillales bacterium]|nr:polysaccharide deacetylase family protein [Rhodospirillales bacterium]
MLRYRLARPWLLLHRARRLVAGAADAGGFRILLFHAIPEDQLDAFDRLVRHVKDRHGVLAPAEAEARIASGAPPSGNGLRSPCVFSFDDGFSSNHALAQTVLARHGVTAIFFVCPGLTDLSGENQRAAIASNIYKGRVKASDLEPGLRLMTWAELESLRRMGHTVGAHGLTHRRLSALAGPRLVREIAGSKARLEEQLGAPAAWFAYPFGDIGSVSAEAAPVIANTFQFCRSGIRGANAAPHNPLALRADNVDLAGPFAYQQLALEGALDDRYAQARRELDSLFTGRTRQ